MRESELAYKYGHFTQPEPQSTVHSHWTLIHWGAMKGLIIFFLACGCSTMQIKSVSSASDECSLTPVIHVLQFPGCVPKPIPSFACIGKCGSYVQVSRPGPVFFPQARLIEFIFPPQGLRQQDLANGALVQLLPGVGREGGLGVSLLPQSKARREKISKGSEGLLSIFCLLLSKFPRTSPANCEDL